MNAGFQNPPLLVEAGGTGQQTEWQILQEDLPLSSLHLAGDQVLARFFNPLTTEQTLGRAYQQTEAWGEPGASIRTVRPKQIVTVGIPQPLPQPGPPPSTRIVAWLDGPMWRVGDNQSRPDPKMIQGLREKIARLEAHLAQIKEEMEQATGRDRYLLQHQSYISERELYELHLSAYLNELKLAMQGEVNEAYLFVVDERVAELGVKLNRLRIKRRIYDYIVEAV